jgi:tetraacyldisaccharide 4'-kinase
MLTNLHLLFLLGRPLGPCYALAMRIRESLYTHGWLRQQSLDIPVISVGNLVLGGTGKTPTVYHLAKFLLQQGYHPAIISRGYKGKARRSVNIVSDGVSLFLTPEMAGDEPCMLAEALAGVPVLTGVRRIHPCRYAAEEFHADVLILDDGFQHLSVKRDIDLVLFDATDLVGNGRVFPGGTLREPESALDRSNLFLITGINEKNRQSATRFSEWLQKRFPARPVFFASHGFPTLQCPDKPESEHESYGSFFAFCGIANPGRFQTSLDVLQLPQSGFLTFPDHVRYTQDMVADICKKAADTGAVRLVTTQKDFVKLKNLGSPLPRYVVEVGLHIEDGFNHAITKLLRKLKQPVPF